jgi:hypothetical protein
VTQSKPERGTDDRTEGRLPVTAEVGSEGGSYADPTVQVATFDGDVERLRGHGGAGSHAAQEARGMDAPAGDDGGMLRYPTESPDAPADPRRRRFDWRSGAAGAAVAALVMLALSRWR